MPQVSPRTASAACTFLNRVPLAKDTSLQARATGPRSPPSDSLLADRRRSLDCKDHHPRAWRFLAVHVSDPLDAGQFAVHPRCAPERILPTDARDEIADLKPDRRTTTTPCRFPPPIRVECSPAPGNHRLGFDDDHSVQDGRVRPVQSHEQAYSRTRPATQREKLAEAPDLASRSATLLS
jgi:hypothetical protein